MRDVRLLTLCKQHYLDNGPRKMKCDISCFGYYDGINIKTVEIGKEENRIALKKSRAPISELWYFTGKESESLKGGASYQNIGLFRCIDYNSEICSDKILNDYWELNAKLPFFAVGFIKLMSEVDYNNVIKEIEKKNSSVSNYEEKIIKVLSYLTFDNADIIILAKGNDIETLEGVLKEIEYMPDISYVHYIWGIDENYLEQCNIEERILDEWNKCKCYIGKSINMLHIETVTEGNDKIAQELKYYLNQWNEKYPIKNYDKCVYFYTAGHANLCIEIPDTDVRALITLMLPLGFSTHCNGSYDRGVYNIETSFVINKNLWEGVIPEKIQGMSNTIENKWCKQWLKKYENYCNYKLSLRDEGLYSQYQSWMQVLNVLDQYERFGMSQDIFFLIFPSLKMFEKNLEKVLNVLYGIDGCDLVERGDHFYKQRLIEYHQFSNQLKVIMSEYIEYINSIINHIIHTEQIYLMIPGYCGTTFSIPIKLNLFYLWYIKSVTNLINDNQREFAHIFMPTMKSSPQTKTLYFPIWDRDNQLICIQVPQRVLFFPRNLMIITAHELGHYVGREYRYREKRRQHIIQILARFIAEGIVLNLADENVGFRQIIRSMMDEMLRKKIIDIVSSDLNRLINGDILHANNLEKELRKTCSNILLNEEKNLDNIYNAIYKIPKEVLNVAEEKYEEYVMRMHFITELQNEYNRKRKELISAHIVDEMICCLLNLFKEIFSDVVSFAILNCDFETYKESFYVSEGMEKNITILPRQHRVRVAVMQNVICRQPKKQDMDKSIGVANPRERLLNDFLNNKFLLERLEQYASDCYDKLRKTFEADEERKSVNRIREVYNMFCNQAFSCNEIFSKINECIEEYRKGMPLDS